MTPVRGIPVDPELLLAASDALRSARENDAEVPGTDVGAAAEMIEQGVFGPSEECVDEYGLPLSRYVDAVAVARSMPDGE